MKAPDPQEFRRLLNFIQEPVLIVSRAGEIEIANAAARALLGECLTGRTLNDFTSTSADRVEAYLKLCAGSGSPVIGSIVLRSANGNEDRHQIKGALLNQSEDRHRGRIILRCSATAFREFARVSRQVEELNSENRRRRHAQAVLEEAVAQRDLLLRELQHRVRNHTQMMLGMVAAAQRKSESQETSDFLAELRRRLVALGTVQQLMYKSAQLEALPAQDLVYKLCESIAEAWPPGAELTADCAEADIPNEVAVPLALIINELLSNALKHGLNYDRGTARVTLGIDQDDLVLTVADSGPGFAAGEDHEHTSSGLTLVRGLCRQIGGSFAISSEDGTRCTVRFPRVSG